MGTVIQKRPGLTETELNRPVAADLFRVLATGMVGWFHIWQQSWQGAGSLTYLARSGAAWVDGMIMLSAFCMFLPWANAMAEGRPCPSADPVTFYKKRAVRILPSYYVCILFSLVTVILQKGTGFWLWKDLLAHLTLTQTFFRGSYIYASLNGVTWTLTILAAFYLMFPFLAKCMFYRPGWVTAALFAVQGVWRACTVPLYGTPEYQMRFNQLPAFAGTLALGMGGAVLFAQLGRSRLVSHWAGRLACTLAGIAALLSACRLLQQLNWSRDYQLWQLEWRTPLVACFTAALVMLGLGLPIPAKGLWGFLSGISYNFYLWHQMLVVFLKYYCHLPAWTGDTPPNQLGDTAWMARANLFFWLVSLAAAVVFTYLVEKPAARYLKKL